MISRTVSVTRVSVPAWVPLVAARVAVARRAGEAVALKLADLHLGEQPAYVVVERGKGGKGRMVPVGPEVAAAIDRYRRARRGHRLEADPALWLGDRGKAFSYDALHKTLKERAASAGLDVTVIDRRDHLGGNAHSTVDDATGIEVLGKLFARFPIERIGAREAA